MTTFRRLLKIAPAAVLICLVLPGSAFGQATRTWVSGTGDDANPCSRTAPCKTLPGAISKTAAGGEINATDSGGFGALNITKSITIDLRSVHGGVLTNVSNGITVNAGPNDRVKIKGLKINGLNSNFHGIRIFSARSVKISDVDIFGWNRNGISVENTNPAARVVISNTRIRDNAGNGVFVAPLGANLARVTVRGSEIDDNRCGITASRTGFDPAFNYAVNCGIGGTNTATAVVNSFRNSISDSDRQGIFANGSTATIRLSQNEIVGSSQTPALGVLNGGSILSYGNNMITGNPGGDGAPTGSITLAKRKKK